jgi:hypothetical protein
LPHITKPKTKGGDFPDARTRLAYVRANASRGADTLTVDTAANVAPGMVRVCFFCAAADAGPSNAHSKQNNQTNQS